MPHFDHALKVAHAFATKLTMYLVCSCICNKINHIVEFDNFVSIGIPYLDSNNLVITCICMQMVMIAKSGTVGGE